MARQITYDLSHKAGWDLFKNMVSQMRLAGKRPKAVLQDGKRSLDQNAMAFALYKQISQQLEDQSIREIRAECKLTVGVPILRASNAKFMAMYDKGLKQLDYEEKLAAMEFIPVTSLMGKKDFSSFLDEVVRVYSQQGISLINPSEAGSYA